MQGLNRDCVLRETPRSFLAHNFPCKCENCFPCENLLDPVTFQDAGLLLFFGIKHLNASLFIQSLVRNSVSSDAANLWACLLHEMRIVLYNYRQNLAYSSRISR